MDELEKKIEEKRSKLVDLQYFGSIELFSTLMHQSNVFFLPDEAYQKALHPNRTQLMGANGPLLLSIPLVGGRDKKQKFKDVQVSYSHPWQNIHWRGINSAYRKSPWFDEYAQELESLFQKREKFLLDLNLKTMRWAINKLNLKVDILAETGLNLEDSSYNLSSVQKDDKRPHFPFYQQVFNDRYGFISNLSILDLLFCEGPKAKGYLQSINFFK